MKNSLGYNWTDYKTNTGILNQLKIISVTEKMNKYKSNLTNRMNRLPDNGFP